MVLKTQARRECLMFNAQRSFLSVPGSLPSIPTIDETVAGWAT
jgi:hypothetical protein